MEKPIKNSLDADPKNFLELWKWFTDDAAKIKDRMWTMATFFYTVLGALLGFVGEHVVSDNGDGLGNFEQPDFVLVAAIAGCFLSGYGMFMLWQYGKHIRSGWNRADYIRFRIEGLNEIWSFNDKKIEKEDKKHRKKHPESIPDVAVVLIILMGLFFLIYTVIFLLVLIYLKNQKTYLFMEMPEIINIVIAATIPLLIFYFGHRLDKRKREEQEAKQAEQDKIERKHKSRIQFELTAIFMGPQAGHYLAEVTMILHNKGLVRNVIDNLNLKVLGIKQDAKITLLERDDQQQIKDLKNVQKPIDQKAKFPETFVDKKMLKNKGSFFVEPGIVQQFTYVARIPEDIRFILVRSKFKYHEKSEHTAQKVYEVIPYNSTD